MTPEAAYVQLGKLVSSDFDVRSRSHSANGDLTGLSAACSTALAVSDQLPIVYTAFDGDLQDLVGFMRSFVLSRNAVPANPESILGYKETVTARMTKRGVLLDDLAVLRRCDELWVFTDYPPETTSVQLLAEGVVIELLYFLKRHGDRVVNFVPITELISGRDAKPIRYKYDYSETERALEPSQRRGVLDLANSHGKVDKEIPAVVYHICDPLDFKYAGWLRAHSYNENLVPLVPCLAVKLEDLPPSEEGLGQVLAAWLRLSNLAEFAWELPPMEPGRSASKVHALLKGAWLQTRGQSPLRTRSWSEYPIPKARVGAMWPLTKREGGLL